MKWKNKISHCTIFALAVFHVFFLFNYSLYPLQSFRLLGYYTNIFILYYYTFNRKMKIHECGYGCNLIFYSNYFLFAHNMFSKFSSPVILLLNTYRIIIISIIIYTLFFSHSFSAHLWTDRRTILEKKIGKWPFLKCHRRVKNKVSWMKVRRLYMKLLSFSLDINYLEYKIKFNIKNCTF